MTILALSSFVVALSIWLIFGSSEMPEPMKHAFRAFIVANLLGCFFLGPEFVLFGWGFNLIAGAFHWFVIEGDRRDEDSFIGTLVVSTHPWAQTILTLIVIVGAVGLHLHYIITSNHEDDE